MKVSMKTNTITSLFTCLNCNEKIQIGKFKLSDNEILCDMCYNIYTDDEVEPSRKKKVLEYVNSKRTEIFDNSDVSSYLNVIYESHHSQPSQENTQFNSKIGRTSDRNIRQISHTNSRNFIDFSLSYPNENNKRLFGEENTHNLYKYINSKQYKHDSKNFSSCCICLNEFNKEELLITMQCQHVFHSKCLSSWLSLNSSCPMCRRDIEF